MVEAKQKDELVPYEQHSPGFEAAYTGETSSCPVQENEMIATPASDAEGNPFRQWSTIPWIFPDKEDGWQDGVWDDAQGVNVSQWPRAREDNS